MAYGIALLGRFSAVFWYFDTTVLYYLSNSKCSSIFDMALQFFSIFPTVMRFWVPSMPPLCRSFD